MIYRRSFWVTSGSQCEALKVGCFSSTANCERSVPWFHMRSTRSSMGVINNGLRSYPKVVSWSIDAGLDDVLTFQRVRCCERTLHDGSTPQWRISSFRSAMWHLDLEAWRMHLPMMQCNSRSRLSAMAAEICSQWRCTSRGAYDLVLVTISRLITAKNEH